MTVQILANAVLTVLSLCALLPFAIMISSSLSEDVQVLKYGYSILPRGFSTDAYRYILSNLGVVGRAYLITAGVTVVGVLLSLAITNSAAYVLSQDELPFRNILMFMVVLTMLFNGGLVPTYYVYTQILHFKDTIFALIIPSLLMNAFNIILITNYYRFSIPRSIIESVRIDGAGVYRTFAAVVLPLALPINATIGLLIAIMYWNDWQNGLYYLTGTKYYSIQQVLRVMSNQLSFLSQAGGGMVSDVQMPQTTIRMAIASCAVIPITIAYPFFQKYFVKGITIGAVKE